MTIEELKDNPMIKGCVIHNNHIIWILSDYGDEYIFSDDEWNEDGFWMTECVPFKEYSHYVYCKNRSDGSIKYVAYAWYNKNESYIEEFTDWERCVNWLIGED